MRDRVRSFIEQLLEELEAALGRGRYEGVAGSNGRRGHRQCQPVTTFGPLSLSVPRARLHDATGEQEWESAFLPAYKRAQPSRRGVDRRGLSRQDEHAPRAPVPVQRCTVHKERNLLAHASKHLYDKIKAEFNGMIHARTAEEVLGKRKVFLAGWRPRCRAVGDS
jgi:transposase-like protein